MNAVRRRYVLVVLAWLWSAPWCQAETVWIAASSAERLVGPVVLGAKTGLAEEDALGDYLVSTICVSPDALTGGHAEYRVDLPAAGRYTIWARLRCPLGLQESFALIPEGAEPSSEPRWALADTGASDRGWHWVPAAGKLALDLPAGQFRFRVYAREAHDTVFGPGGWAMARPMFNPRLNVICLSADSDYVPTDADAQRALGVAPSHFSDESLRATASPLPPVSVEESAGLGKKPIPDWLRCPRFYTKDAWRSELEYRQQGDIAFMVRQIAACEGNAFRLAAYWGGEAYFQSDTVPHAPGLGSIDYLREATEMGRRLGVHVLMYVNPNCLYEDHPLFDQALVRRPDGSGWGGNRYGIRDAHFVCINNPAYRELLRRLLAEAFTRYELAGLYVDGLTPHRCFCRDCRDKYRAMFGCEMPVDKFDGPQWTVLWEMVSQPQPAGDPNDPDTARYTEFLDRSLAEATALVSETVRTARPGAVTLYHSWPKPATLGDYDGTLTEIYVKQPWQHSLWKFGELSNYSNVFSIPVLFNIYLHDHGTAAEARTKMQQGLAGGCYPNFWNTLGMKPMFRFLRENAACFDFARTVPTRFAVLPRGISNETAQQRLASDRTSPARSVRDRFLAPYVGLYSAVARGGLPIVSRQRSDFHRDLAGFQVLLLANEACLSDEQAAAVRRFVAAGGGLVATHETSLYDERGNRRPDFALADVFGVHYEAMLAPAARSVQGLADHPVTRSLAGGPALPHDDAHAVVRAAGAETLAALVQDGQPAVPSVLVHTLGKGRVVYLPGRLDAIQCAVVTPAIEQLMQNAVRWASGGNVPAEAHADVPLAVTSFEQADRRVIHLVSLNGDTLYRSDAVGPAGQVAVQLQVPAGRSIAQVRRLWTQENVPFTVRGSAANLVLENVGEYEVLAVEWQ